jgi:hypothetical protein
MTTVEVSEVAILAVHSRSIAQEKLAWKHSLGVLENEAVLGGSHGSHATAIFSHKHFHEL